MVAINEISKKRLGATAVNDDKNKLIGIITDGDVRRMFEKYEDFKTLTAKDIMSMWPKMIQCDSLATEALEVMKKNNISQLIVMDKDAYAGILHLHDLIREGII